MSTATLDRDKTAQATSKLVTISAWTVPVLVLGQFAMLAIVPVGLVLYGTLRKTRTVALRWLAGALTAAYAVPLAIWAIRPDPAPSLSKDISPVFAGIIVAAAIAVAVTSHVLRRKSAG
jgi:hypothetical protein